MSITVRIQPCHVGPNGQYPKVPPSSPCPPAVFPIPVGADLIIDEGIPLIRFPGDLEIDDLTVTAPIVIHVEGNLTRTGTLTTLGSGEPEILENSALPSYD